MAKRSIILSAHCQLSPIAVVTISVRVKIRGRVRVRVVVTFSGSRVSADRTNSLKSTKSSYLSRVDYNQS